MEVSSISNYGCKFENLLLKYNKLIIDYNELHNKYNHLLYNNKVIVKKMFLTSISPDEASIDRQLKAIKSWDNLAIIYSVNIKQEIQKLKTIFTMVNFIETVNTGEEYFKKPYVYINELLIQARNIVKDGLICLINSDILIDENINKLDDFYNLCNGDNLVMANRYDFNNQILDGSIQEWGIDVFLFHSKFVSFFNQKIYCLGQPWWDLWLPSTICSKGIDLIHYKKPLFYHKNHENRWNSENYEYLHKEFDKEFYTEKLNSSEKYFLTIKKAKVIQ